MTRLIPFDGFIKVLDVCLVTLIDILKSEALRLLLGIPSCKPPSSPKMLFKSITFVALLSSAAAQSPAYGQCGGQGWSGSQSCVSGYTCKAQSEYYSQCLPGSGTFSPHPTTRTPLIISLGGSNPTTTARTTTRSTSSAPPANTGGSSSGGNGKSYSASFTQYGSTDTWGSGNCQTKSTACGFYTQGYNAAVSQNVFGVGPVLVPPLPQPIPRTPS